MSNWYYTLNGQQQGPVAAEQIQQFIQAGQLHTDALVWKEGMANWAPVGTIAELMAGAAPAASPALAGQPAASPYASPNTPVQGGGMLGGGASHNQPMPATYLWQSIAVTCCCCLPFGIVSIVKAASVSSKYNSGDYAGAVAASESAKTWAMWGMICGIVAIVLNIVLQGFIVNA